VLLNAVIEVFEDLLPVRRIRFHISRIQPIAPGVNVLYVALFGDAHMARILNPCAHPRKEPSPPNQFHFKGGRPRQALSKELEQNGTDLGESRSVGQRVGQTGQPDGSCWRKRPNRQSAPTCSPLSHF
jgi:hypothetical protein